MKKALLLATILLLVLFIVTTCSNGNHDTLTKDKLDLSKVSFQMKVDHAHMIQDFGIYDIAENEVGIVVRGTIEKGKIHKNSPIVFVDENGNVLHHDTVFKILINERYTGFDQDARRPSYAESGDEVSLYLEGWNGNDLELYDKYDKNLELIRESSYAVL